MIGLPSCSLLFFFNDTATTEIYTLSLHDALPIYHHAAGRTARGCRSSWVMALVATISWGTTLPKTSAADRKSTRLNSSHLVISYAVFCLKKKKQTHHIQTRSLDTQIRRQR